MKLKVSEHELRVRLSRAEIEQLAREGRLELIARLVPDRALTVVLEASEGASGLALEWAGDRLVVSMPASDAALWARSGQVGFAAPLAHGLTLRLEWDVKDGLRRAPRLDEGDDDRDELSD